MPDESDQDAMINGNGNGNGNGHTNGKGRRDDGSEREYRSPKSCLARIDSPDGITWCIRGDKHAGDHVPAPPRGPITTELTKKP